MSMAFTTRRMRDTMNTKTSNIIQSVNKFTNNHAPLILTATGSIGVVCTAVLAAKAGPRARAAIFDYDMDNQTNATAFEKVKVTWKIYLPTAICAVATISTLFCGNHIALKRGANLMQAYSILDSTFQEYKGQVKKTLGEKEERTIDDALSEQKVASSNNAVIINGPQPLTMDDLSGRYFRIDAEKIRQAQNALNARLLQEDWISLNVFYGLLGLDPIGLGDDIGWNADRLLDIRFTSCLTADEEPCLVIKYDTVPKPDYYKGY